MPATAPVDRPALAGEGVCVDVDVPVTLPLVVVNDDVVVPEAPLDVGVDVNVADVLVEEEESDATLLFVML